MAPNGVIHFGASPYFGEWYAQLTINAESHWSAIFVPFHNHMAPISCNMRKYVRLCTFMFQRVAVVDIFICFPSSLWCLSMPPRVVTPFGAVFYFWLYPGQLGLHSPSSPPQLSHREQVQMQVHS